MDAIDLRLLKMLRENSRESLANMAGRLKISKATVSRRISRMEEDGYIAGYTVVINPSRLGLMRAIIGMEVIGPGIDQVIEELKKLREIAYIHKVFGDHNLICEVHTKSVDSLYDLIQSRILKVPNVKNVEVDILIEKVDLNPDAELDLIPLQPSLGR